MSKPVLLVMAAGMGSRYGGVKQIEGVGLHGETLLDYATYDAQRAGYGKAVYIIRKDIEKDFRERIFDRIAKNFDAEYVFQDSAFFLNDEQRKAAVGRVKPWGTLHAVLCAREKLTVPWTVINADDYYGRASFESLGKWLSGIDNKSCEQGIVAWTLKNTMSRAGTVSRGVCDTKDGCLVSMTEHKKIGWEGKRVFSVFEEDGAEAGGGAGGGVGMGGGAGVSGGGGGKKIELSGNEAVSMNFFGFSPAVLDFFEEFFKKFIEKNASSEKAECLLPDAASSFVQEGKGKIKVFMTEENWFGMTYTEDREIVRANIAEKIKSGYYPETLWE